MFVWKICHAIFRNVLAQKQKKSHINAGKKCVTQCLGKWIPYKKGNVIWIIRNYMQSAEVWAWRGGRQTHVDYVCGKGDTSNHTLVLSMFFFFLRKKKAIPNLKELEIINLKAVPRIFDFFIGKWSHDILCDQAKNKF